MSLSLDLDRESSHPLYQQIAEAIKRQISDGRLPRGTQLPTVRHLAKSLGVTRLTVHSAYNELQADGWVEATVGRGTFVTESVRPQHVLEHMGRQITTDGVLDHMERATQIPGLRSLAYAVPDDSLLAAEEFLRVVPKSDTELMSVLQYSMPQGDTLLRTELAKYLREREIEALPDEILVTSGVTQGFALVAQGLARPGDYVAVERPTYVGLLHTLRSQGLRPIGVPLDEEGPQVEELERIMRQYRPRFFYTIATYHNPTGVCASASRRIELLALAEKYGVLLVEDDVYARFAYDAAPPPALKAADNNDMVVYLDSFSKVLWPGVRVGYMVAPRSLHERFLSLRRAADLCGPALLQRAVGTYLQRGMMSAHLKRSRSVYRDRRDALLESLQYWMPSTVHWSRPTGGLCCWITVPALRSLEELYLNALRQGVHFTPGSVFLAEPESQAYLRLCFGNQPPEAIRPAVATLAHLITEGLEPDAVGLERAAARIPLV